MLQKTGGYRMPRCCRWSRASDNSSVAGSTSVNMFVCNLCNCMVGSSIVACNILVIWAWLKIVNPMVGEFVGKLLVLSFEP